MRLFYMLLRACVCARVSDPCVGGGVCAQVLASGRMHSFGGGVGIDIRFHVHFTSYTPPEG